MVEMVLEERLCIVGNYAQFDALAEINGKQSTEPFGVNLFAINRTNFTTAKEWWMLATLALPTLLQWLSVLGVKKTDLIHDVSHTFFSFKWNECCLSFELNVQSKSHNEIDSKGRTQMVEIDEKKKNTLCWPFDSNAFNISISTLAILFFTQSVIQFIQMWL